MSPRSKVHHSFPLALKDRTRDKLITVAGQSRNLTEVPCYVVSSLIFYTILIIVMTVLTIPVNSRP